MPNTMQWTHRLWRGVIARCPWSHTGPAGPAALPLLLRSSLFFLSSLWLASISLIFDTLEDLLQYTVFWLLDPFAIPYKEKTQRLRTRAAVLIELKLIQCNRPLIQTSLIHTSCCSGIERQHTSQEFPSNLILFDFAFTFQVCCIIMILVLINVEKSDLDL